MFKISKSFFLFLFSFLILGLLSQKVQAMPVLNIDRTLTQPDGSKFIGKMWGDEYSSGWETENGYTIIKDDSTGYWKYAVLNSSNELSDSGVEVGKDIPDTITKKIRPSKSSTRQNSVSRAPSSQPNASVSAAGTAKFLVIMINFTDTTMTYGQSAFQQMLFGTGTSGVTGPGTLHDYYEEVSNNKFNVTGNVCSTVYTAPKSHNYYGYINGDSRIPVLVKQAVQALDSNIDFSQYDNDGDGKVDNVIIIHQGEGAEASGDSYDIWSHNWSLSEAGIGNITLDGVKIDSYTIQPEQYLYGAKVGIGVFAHELGHTLGLPDLYDTDGSSSGIGDWCLMSSGSWGTTLVPGDTPSHLSAWCKSKLGWVAPIVINSSQAGKTINPIETSPSEIYQLLSNSNGVDWTFGSKSGTGEYFLIENRQNLKFDAALPGRGLLIWHIDEAATYTNTANANEDGVRLVALEQADGKFSLENSSNESGDMGDPYPGIYNKTSFNSSTAPNSKLYSGTASNLSLSSISESNQTITLNISVSTVKVTLNSTSVSLSTVDGYNEKQLTATISPSSTIDKTVTWSSDNPSVATVDDNGLVTAVGNGTANITATSSSNKECTATCKVSVIGVESVVLSQSSLIIQKGSTSTLTAIINPTNALLKDVTWTTNKPDVVTVASGKLTAVGAGTATITVTTKDGSKKAMCTVTVVDKLATKITLDKTTLTLNLSTSSTYNLNATISPSDADIFEDPVTWSSSDESVATVSDSGMVTAKSSGKATVTATSTNGNKTATCTVNVIPVTGVSLNKNLITMVLVNGTATDSLTATISPTTAVDKSVIWSSSDETVVKVSSSGKLTAVGTGKATITVTTNDGSYTATCTVMVVNKLVKSISLDKTTLTLNTTTKSFYTLIPTITPSDAEFSTITWASSNENVATVDSNGVVTAKGAGKAVITAKTLNSGRTATCSVSVIPVTGVSLNKTLGTMILVNGTASGTLIAKILPTNAADNETTWSSSDENVVVVTDGKLTAKGFGKAIVTVTTKDGEYTASCIVTVLNKPVTKITLNKTSLSLNTSTNSTDSLLPTITTTDSENIDKLPGLIVWSSSNSNVATVDSSGNIIAVGAGKATITANIGGRTASCIIYVR